MPQYTARMNANVNSGPDETPKRHILDCAETRFRTFGYRKTTMSEIAEDAGMSAANIYRFYENKHDLAAACAQRCMRERTDLLRDAARKNTRSAAERLHGFVLTMLRYTHEMTADQPKINELVEMIASRKLEVVKAKNQAEIALIAEILAFGNQTGEFAVNDVVSAATTVHGALVLFNVPIFMALYPLARFEDMAEQTVKLLICGLRA